MFHINSYSKLKSNQTKIRNHSIAMKKIKATFSNFRFYVFSSFTCTFIPGLSDRVLCTTILFSNKMLSSIALCI